ncbi:hypothetical protein CHARACLAT_006162 [Characodon lateralis]|uniref:Secreted protein n=1 Tax=Characodon lateralis TaxID=208331 RepID=A0ABU7CQ36_9TELE|nr:hypothetical protein [Characodon lateralis]
MAALFSKLFGLALASGFLCPSPRRHVREMVCGAWDQLLVVAVFLSCPLERGGSQLERAARGYALFPLCGETHRGIERRSAGAERRWKIHLAERLEMAVT